jgi:hypothetical protein
MAIFGHANRQTLQTDAIALSLGLRSGQRPYKTPGHQAKTGLIWKGFKSEDRNAAGRQRRTKERTFEIAVDWTDALLIITNIVSKFHVC